jgi:hypothetical protein
MGYKKQEVQMVEKSEEFQQGWDARRKHQPFDEAKSVDWRSGWEAALRDDQEEEAFFARGDYL